MEISKISGALFGFFAVLLSTQLHAVSLPVDTTVLLSGTTVADRPELGGPIIVDELHDFTGLDALGNIAFTGELQVRIVRSDVDGTLDFYYRITPNNGPDDIFRTTHTDFAGWATDVDYRIDGLGDVGPAMATRDGDGTTVGFVFLNGLDAGLESLFYFIDTEALYYKPGSTQIINGGTAVVPTYAPSTTQVIPVPAAVWLFGSGLIGLVAVARRRKAA